MFPVGRRLGGGSDGGTLDGYIDRASFINGLSESNREFFIKYGFLKYPITGRKRKFQRSSEMGTNEPGGGSSRLGF